MNVDRHGDKVEIHCTAQELADILREVWSHSPGTCAAARRLTVEAEAERIIPGMVR